MPQSIKGTVRVYHESKRLACFESDTGATSATQALILIPGLTDGLLALPYTQRLATALSSRPQGASALIQPILSSSYLGYGVGSLDTDVEELVSLIEFVTRELNYQRVVLMGHSTGCQDVVHLCKLVRESQPEVFAKIAAVILQGAVSDRDYLSTLDTTASNIALAEDMVKQGKKDELMPRSTDEAPITAGRFLSLSTKLGHDDMFSNDLTSKEMESIFGNLVMPTLLLVSMMDEYVPAGVDLANLGSRILEAIPSANKSCILLPKANHAVSDDAEQQALVDAVQALLDSI